MASHTAAWAQSPAAASSLPLGFPITIISDETVDPRVRPGSEFRAHLRDALSIGDTLVATAGTPARLVVTAKDTAKDGTPSYRIAIVGLNLGLAGTLPVRPDTPTVSHIVTGMEVRATTLASVGLEAGKVRVAVPLPFKLSNERPNGSYTPAPLRTAAPIINRRRATPSPTASPAPSPTASPAPSSTPSSTPSEAASPTSTATPGSTATNSPASTSSARPAPPLPAPT